MPRILKPPVLQSTLGGGLIPSPMVFSPTVYLRPDDGVFTGGARTLLIADKASFNIADASQTGLDPLANDFSIAGWVYLTATSGVQTIISKGGANAASDPGYRVFANGTTLGCWVCSGTGSYTPITIGTVAAGQWYFFAVTANRDGNLAGYLNAVAGTPGDMSSYAAASLNSSWSMTLGAYTTTGPTDLLGGSIASIGFWSRVLTPTEITYLYNLKNARVYAELGIAGTDGASLLTNLVSYWNCNETDPTTGLTDQHSTNDLTRTSAELLTNTGFETRGGRVWASFAAGDKAHLEAADHATLDYGTGDFLNLASIYRTSTGNQVLYSKYEDANNYVKWEIDSSHHQHFIAVVGGATKIEMTGTTALSSTSAAYTLGLKVDRSNPGKCTFYVNGVVDPSGASTNVNDGISTNDGTMSGFASNVRSTSVPTTCLVSESLTFDGVDAYVSLPTGASTRNLAQATVSAWVNLADTPADNDGIYYESTDNNGSSRLAVYVTTSRTVIFAARDTSSGTAFTVTSSSALTIGQWYHVCGTYNSDTDAMTLYVNGSPDGTPNTATKGVLYDAASTNTVAIGASTAVGAFHYFAGGITDTRLYNTALSASQVAELAAGTEATGATPVGKWIGYEHTTSTDDISNAGKLYVAQSGAGTLYFDGKLAQLGIGKPADVSAAAVNTAMIAYHNSGIGKYYFDVSAGDRTTLGLTSWWDLHEASGNRTDDVGGMTLSEVLTTELVTNGTFGTDITGWANYLSGWDVAFERNAGTSRLRFAKSGDGNPSTSFLYTDPAVPLTANRSYTIAYNVNRTSGNGITVRYCASMSNNAQQGYTSSHSDTATVSATTFTPTVSSGVLAVSGTNSAASDWELDNVSITAASIPCSVDAGLFTGWTAAVAGGSTVNDETTSVDAGSHACRLGMDASYNVAYVEQAVMTTGNSYLWSVRAKISDDSAVNELYHPVTGTTFISLTTSYATYGSTDVAGGTSFSLCRYVTTANKSIYLDAASCKSAAIAVGNGPSEAIASDSIGSNHLTFTGVTAAGQITNWVSSVPTPLASQLGYAFQFDGVDDYAYKTSVLTLASQTAVTLTGWFKITGTTPANSYAGFTVGTFNSGDICIRYSKSTDKWSAVFATTDEAKYHYVLSGATVTKNQWYFLAATFENSGVKFYVDSVDQGAQTTSGVPTFAQMNGAAANNVYIGGANGSSTDDNIGQFLPAVFDDCRIYNSALSAAQIAQLYAGGEAKVGGTSDGAVVSPYAHWKFDDGPFGIPAEGDPVWGWESLEGNRYLTVNTTPSYRPVHRLTGINSLPAEEFDGSNDYLRLAGTAPFTSVDAWTAAVVIQPDSVNVNQAVLGYADEGSANNFLWFGVDSTGVATVQGKVGTNAFSVKGDTLLQIGVKYLLTLTFNGTNYQLRVNGYGETEVRSGTEGSFTDLANVDSWTVGGLLTNSTTTVTYPFNGMITEPAIYSSELTASRLAALELYYSRRYGITLSDLNATYLLYDSFTTADDAPVTSPRNCEGGPGTLTFVQTDGTMAVAGGKLAFTAQTTPAWGDQGFYGSGVARTAGKCLLCSRKITTQGGEFVGFYTLASVADATMALGCNTSNVLRVSGGSIVGTYTEGVEYELALVLRASGGFGLVRGGIEYPNWTLVWVFPAETTATLYPMFTNYNAAGTLDNFRIPATLWTPVPIASDSFNRADSTNLGVTDGAGAEETGGSGLAWVEYSTGGTVDCSIASNRLYVPTSIVNYGGAVVDAGQANVVVQVTSIFAGTGDVSLVVRYQDSINFWVAAYISDGLNVHYIQEIVNGTATVRASASMAIGAATYSLLAIADGTTITSYVDSANRCSYGSATNFQTATKCGVNAYKTNSSFDSFVCWARTQTLPSF